MTDRTEGAAGRASATRGEIEVGAVLDAGRFRGLPLLVMVLCAVIMILDGFDIQVIGFAAPSIAADFAIERAALAPAFAAALIGMAVGGFTIGPWGDRAGRRPAILFSVLLFASGTLLTAFVSSLWPLVALRFVTGIGLGGALPNATALMAEFAPPHARNQAIATAIVGVPVGGMVGAAIGAEIIPIFGWPAIFVVGGAMPLAALILLFALLPESPRYLATRPERGAELASILNRVVGDARFSREQTFVLAPPPGTARGASAGVGALFSTELRRDTLATWLVFITNLFAVYCFFNWSPVVLTSLGLDLATAVRGSLVFNTAGLVGALVSSWVIARRGSRWPITALASIGAVAMVVVATLVGVITEPGAVPVVGIMLGIALAGFAILAVQVAMYPVAAHVYPTLCRSAGVGWASGMGRIGGVLSAFVGAALIAAGGGMFFLGIGGVLLLTILGVLMIRNHVPAAVGHRA